MDKETTIKNLFQQIYSLPIEEQIELMEELLEKLEEMRKEK